MGVARSRPRGVCQFEMPSSEPILITVSTPPETPCVVATNKAAIAVARKLTLQSGTSSKGHLHQLLEEITTF